MTTADPDPPIAVNRTDASCAGLPKRPGDSRSAKLLRGFDRAAKRARPVLVKHYDDAFARDVIRDARREFERIIPELPYIGGRRSLFTPVIVINGWIIALFRAMRAREKSTEEVVRTCCEVADDFLRSFPRVVLHFAGKVAFSRLVRMMLGRDAARSQERRYPEDFVYTVGKTADGEWALEFTECAVNKLYDAQGVAELKPYCNFFDVAYSRVMGMGVDARSTIGLGCETCSLRYKHGRETVIPERLKGLLPDT